MERTLPIVDGGRTRTLRTRHEVPRTCAVRQAFAAWGRQQPTLPLLMEQPGRTQDEGPAVNTATQLFDNTKIGTPVELGSWLSKNYSNQFVTVATEKLRG